MHTLLFWIILSFGLIAAAPSKACGSDRSVIVYTNGVNNTEEYAIESLTVLNRELNGRLDANIDRSCLDFKLAYNDRFTTSEGKLISLVSTFDQIIEAGIQRGVDVAANFWTYWNSLVGVEVPEWFSNIQRTMIFSATSIFQPDLIAHELLYSESLGRGDRVVVVAHSQGNLYANQAYFTVTALGGANRFSIIAVATPASIIAGGGPNITLRGDFITLVPLSLGSTIENATPTLCPESALTLPAAVRCHNFIESYLAGNNSLPAIILGVSNAIRTDNGPENELIAEGFGSVECLATNSSAFFTAKRFSNNLGHAGLLIERHKSGQKSAEIAWVTAPGVYEGTGTLQMHCDYLNVTDTHIVVGFDSIDYTLDYSGFVILDIDGSILHTIMAPPPVYRFLGLSSTTFYFAMGYFYDGYDIYRQSLAVGSTPTRLGRVPDGMFLGKRTVQIGNLSYITNNINAWGPGSGSVHTFSQSDLVLNTGGAFGRLQEFYNNAYDTDIAVSSHGVFVSTFDNFGTDEDIQDLRFFPRGGLFQSTINLGLPPGFRLSEAADTTGAYLIPKVGSGPILRIPSVAGHPMSIVVPNALYPTHAHSDGTHLYWIEDPVGWRYQIFRRRLN